MRQKRLKVPQPHIMIKKLHKAMKRIIILLILLPLSGHSQNTDRTLIEEVVLTVDSIKGSNADIQTFLYSKKQGYSRGGDQINVRYLPRFRSLAFYYGTEVAASYFIKKGNDALISNQLFDETPFSYLDPNERCYKLHIEYNKNSSVTLVIENSSSINKLGDKLIINAQVTSGAFSLQKNKPH